MKNMNDFNDICKVIAQRKKDEAGSDLYSIVLGEVSTPELEYRKSMFNDFLSKSGNFEPDGSCDETISIIKKIEDKINSRQ